MKKVLVMVALVMVSVIVYAFNDRAEAKQGKKEVTGNNGEVVVMNKEMFLKNQKSGNTKATSLPLSIYMPTGVDLAAKQLLL